MAPVSGLAPPEHVENKDYGAFPRADWLRPKVIGGVRATPPPSHFYWSRKYIYFILLNDAFLFITSEEIYFQSAFESHV